MKVCCNKTLFVKIGMELYLQNGPKVIEVIQSLGHRIFLDLKLHDIPNTVYGAAKGLAKQAAVRILENPGPSPPEEPGWSGQEVGAVLEYSRASSFLLF